MSYYDFNKVDLPIARQVEKEGIQALLNEKVNMANMLSLFFKIINYCAYCIPEFHQSRKY